jgi:hypothetical protein
MTRKIDITRAASVQPPALGELLTRTTADLLAKQVREIERQLAEPGGLDSPARGLDFYDAWAAQHRATRVYSLTPWEAAALEKCVILSGTFRFSPNPLHEPLPGIPKQWLHGGGPHGDDDRLRVNPGRSLDNRIRDLIEKAAIFKPRGVLFYVTSLPKSQYGFAGIQTMAYSSATCTVKQAELPGEKVIRLRRAQG